MPGPWERPFQRAGTAGPRWLRTRCVSRAVGFFSPTFAPASGIQYLSLPDGPVRAHPARALSPLVSDFGAGYPRIHDSARSRRQSMLKVAQETTFTRRYADSGL
jgi:hypothetical protein